MIDNTKTTPSQDRQLAEALMAMIARVDYTRKLTNEALVHEVIDKVWGPLKWGEQEEALLHELIERFKDLAGIEDEVEYDAN